MSEWTNLDQVFGELEAECEDIVRGLTVRVWNSVLSRTPQFYGRMVSSWNYTLDPSDAVDRSDQIETTLDDGNKFAEGLLHRGHPAAIAIANAANFGNDYSFKLGQTVWLTNGAPHAMKVESGELKLRAINQPGTPVTRTLDWVQSTWGKGITSQAAANLKTLTIS